MASIEHRLDRLQQRLHDLAQDLQLVRTLLHRDVPSTLNKVRYITEGVLFRLCKAHDVSWGKAEPTLENMLGPLIAAGVVPKNIGVHLRTIQSNASPGSHYQEAKLDASHVDIAVRALVDVLEWLLERQGETLDAPSRAWPPRIVHPLQPARHFAGRAAIFERLRAWWTTADARDRVVSIVAVGGTGKTALVERLLAEPAPDGVFAWSFYEDQRTEALLADALAYLGIEHVEPGGRLERLRGHLATAREAHTFVFDGLEALQSSGGAGKLRGRIEDASIRLLVRSIAAGLGRTRLVVTSRARLVDLDDWANRGYVSISLDDLDVEATRQILRDWGVRGDDATLDRVHARVGGHALSVAVLGSYLATFCAGDPGAADTIALEVAAEDDPLAAKLARVLDRYADALPELERDVLVRLAAFPRGTTVELLEFLARSPDVAVAGRLAGVPAPELQRVLDRLARLGLVYATRVATAPTYSAHPFLRQHLKRLLGVGDDRVHGTVSDGLAPTLAGTPRTAISDPALLDRFERLIEHMRLAGRTRDALLVFQRTLGGYMTLGPILGEYGRGWRISSGLLEDRRTGATADDGPEDRAILCNQAALFAQALGDAAEARRLFEAAIALARPRRASNVIEGATENLADLERISGRLDRASSLVRGELEHRGRATILQALAAVVFQQAGLPDEARTWFVRCDPSGAGDPLAWIYRGMYLAADGDRDGARAAYEQGLSRAQASQLALDAARCHLGLGHLEPARAWALRTGHVETLIRCHQLAAELAIAAGDRDAARYQIVDGKRLAESAGFLLYAAAFDAL